MGFIKFIKSFFQKEKSTPIAEPTISEEQQEKLEKKAKHEALAQALSGKAEVVKKKRNASNKK
jgi:hypothetical protein